LSRTIARKPNASGEAALRRIERDLLRLMAELDRCAELRRQFPFPEQPRGDGRMIDIDLRNLEFA
jgi:hypothetical protein